MQYAQQNVSTLTTTLIVMNLTCFITKIVMHVVAYSHMTASRNANSKIKMEITNKKLRINGQPQLEC